MAILDPTGKLVETGAFQGSQRFDFTESMAHARDNYPRLLASSFDKAVQLGDITSQPYAAGKNLFLTAGLIHLGTGFVVPYPGVVFSSGNPVAVHFNDPFIPEDIEWGMDTGAAFITQWRFDTIPPQVGTWALPGTYTVAQSASAYTQASPPYTVATEVALWLQGANGSRYHVWDWDAVGGFSASPASIDSVALLGKAVPFFLEFQTTNADALPPGSGPLTVRFRSTSYTPPP